MTFPNRSGTTEFLHPCQQGRSLLARSANRLARAATILWVIVATMVPAVAQIAITGSTADYELAPGPVLGSTTATTSRAGASNAASNPGLRNLVYIFALPAAPGGQVVTSAKLSFTLGGQPNLQTNLSVTLVN